MYAAVNAATSDSTTPSITDPTFQQAINGPDAVKWREAMNREHDALIKKEVWQEVLRLKTMRVLPGKWVLKIKQNEVIIIVYVDDILLFGKDKQLVTPAKQKLCNAYEMRDMG
jgi:hypothetical protein